MYVLQLRLLQTQHVHEFARACFQMRDHMLSSSSREDAQEHQTNHNLTMPF